MPASWQTSLPPVFPAACSVCSERASQFVPLYLGIISLMRATNKLHDDQEQEVLSTPCVFFLPICLADDKANKRPMRRSSSPNQIGGKNGKHCSNTQRESNTLPRLIKWLKVYLFYLQLINNEEEWLPKVCRRFYTLQGSYFLRSFQFE